MRLYLCFYYICKLIIRKKYTVERKRRRVRDGREEADRIPEYCEEF